jgi:hypothetical protein
MPVNINPDFTGCDFSIMMPFDPISLAFVLSGYIAQRVATITRVPPQSLILRRQIPVRSRPVECLVAVPFKAIVEIRFKAAIVVVLKIENKESNYKFRHKDSTRFAFSALGNDHRRTKEFWRAFPDFRKRSEKSSGSCWINSGGSGSPQSDSPFPLVPKASMNGIDFFRRFTS